MTSEKRSASGKLEIEDGNPDRGTWSGKLDFLLSALGYAVGLGNVWRFPYLCYKNGGGTFLIPYFLMLAIIGIPTFLLELLIGQYSAMGPAVVYKHISPVFKGLGFANIFAQSFVGLYYNMIIAWTIYYMFASFTSDLPWQYCNNEYNDGNCFSVTAFKECEAMRANMTDSNIIFLNRTCITEEKMLAPFKNDLEKWYGSTRKVSAENNTVVPCIFTNVTYCDPAPGAVDKIGRLFDIPVGLRASSSGQFLRRSVLQEESYTGDLVSIDPSEFGTPTWALTLCLLAAWIIIFLCLVKGIQSSGKVVYFTATFPYVVLIILLIRAVTLPGASLGINFYLVPDWSKLGDVSVWNDAAAQIFFSLSVAGGGLVTLASYNKFHNNILRDTMIVCIGNCMTSFTAGFAIFSVLGFMATELGVEVKDVAKSGTGLAFEAYPDLVTRLPLPTLWAILFFAMLFTLGLDSQFAIVETILTGILDLMPHLRPKKTLVVGGLCLAGFILGLPLCCPGGSLLLDLLDTYAAVWPYLFIGMVELCIIAYVYGYSNFIDDIYEMTGSKIIYKLKKPMMVFYCALSPIAIGVILIASWAQYQPITRGDYVYPGWANGIGWLIAMTAILSVPLMAVVTVVAAYRRRPDEGLMAAFNREKQHTADWRQNAAKANREDGEGGEFEYRQEGERLIRYRRGTAPLPPKYNGYDNAAMRSEL